MTAKRMTQQQILQRLGGEGFLQKILGHVLTVGQATDETGRPGTVTLTVKTFKPKEGEIGDLYVGFETECRISKLPTPKPRKTGLYVSDMGITSDNPMQEEMDFRVVETGTTDARTVGGEPPVVREA